MQAGAWSLEGGEGWSGWKVARLEAQAGEARGLPIKEPLKPQGRQQEATIIQKPLPHGHPFTGILNGRPPAIGNEDKRR